MAISTPALSQTNAVANAKHYAQKQSFIQAHGYAAAGSYMTQATVLVYDDILRAQNSKQKIDVIDTLTPTQQMAVYFGIKEIYQPMYGVSGSPYYDETYFNLLKGYVGSYFYKQYSWFNTDQSLNILEFAALNLGNALYQFIDAVASPESITEAYNDYAEQAMGVFRAWQEQGNDSTYFVRKELYNKIIKIQLFDEAGTATIVVYAGFDGNGTLVVYDSKSYLSVGTVADIARFDYDSFAGNAMWMMDELVGIESDWDGKASASSTTAFGYAQFTEASVETAVNRYFNHIDRYNARSTTRDWNPWSHGVTPTFSAPYWLTRLRAAINSTYDHEFEVGRLTYDQTIALAMVHMHSGKSKDSNFILMGTGDVDAAKALYKNNHHTNPDAATLLRLDVTIQPARDKAGTQITGTDPGFFRIHYVPASQIAQDIATSVNAFTQGAPGLIAVDILISAGHFLKEQTLDRIFTPAYKANVTAVKAANGVP